VVSLIALMTEVILYATIELARIARTWRTFSVNKPTSSSVYQAGSYLLCVFWHYKSQNGLKGTEFSGGWLTGPLLSLEDTGTALFIASVVLTFVFRELLPQSG